MINPVTEKIHGAGSREQNRCLATLSPDALAQLAPHCKSVLIAAGTLLWESGRPERRTYFPASGLVSITLPMQDGSAIEVGTVGCESAVGGLDAAAETEMTRAAVLIGGYFTQIDSSRLAEIARQNREINHMVSYCRDWLYAQAQQLAACNAVHAADKRLCRWLTACQQRAGDGRIFATQETIGALLGMRRTTVTLIAQDLHTHGLIDYARGRITIRDPARLAAAACECWEHLGPARWPSARLQTMHGANFSVR